ncbi:MAG: tRNA-(ms[2]io[6]A)-hydroxylase [Planctomycetes bacterium]|jgi:tRNA-(ms[2]io[6]A)-hydroxylase|nr:tRNA-(ms[2]io[6]A)-hydroxylase [Planctomycetota bacterium]
MVVAGNPTALCSAYVTPLAWAEAQRPHLDELLIEQAHLEKKAAAAAVQFLFRLGDRTDAQKELSALAREELLHFERTLRVLASRGIVFRTLPPSPYAGQLKAVVAGTMPERLLDELWISACIEARSHERMGLLATALQPFAPEVAAFYADLCAAEARHAPLYAELAATLAPSAVVAARRQVIERREAEVLRQLPFAPRLHSGWPEVPGE